MECSYDVDRNLDGKFDEKDKDVKINLNVGVLTSNYSFSCANMFPAMMKDYGVALIGQQSGGGSCCVLFNPSAEVYLNCQEEKSTVFLYFRDKTKHSGEIGRIGQWRHQIAFRRWVRCKHGLLHPPTSSLAPQSISESYGQSPDPSDT